ncbi:MAG TPA: pitrilysin family protein [Gemmatimonadota bacterium]|nr:pitrilysin family protein [Gemmatimonadota bacterium]
MPLEHERHPLSCGATVLTRPLAANEIVSIRAFLPMGSLYEDDAEAGISRMVQNLLPRGTATRTAHEIQDALGDLGADLDTGAGVDLGSASLRATSATWEDALEIFLDVLTGPVFPQEEVETEVERTLGEIEAREDQLMTRAMDLFREEFYGGHPAHKPVIGYRGTVAAMDRDRIAAAARRFYRPVPRVVVAVGRFDPDTLVDRLEAAFGRTPLAPPPERPAAHRPRAGTRRLEVDREAAYLVHGYPAPSYGDAEYPVARVADAILGGSMASRLFVELREKRSLAYQVSSLYDDRVDGSYQAGYIVTDPERVGEAAEGLEREFRRIAEEPVGEDEIERARRHLRGRFLIGAETNAAQGSRLGQYETYGLGQDFGDRWQAALDAVTPEALGAFGRRRFSGEATRALVVPAGATVQ